MGFATTREVQAIKKDLVAAKSVANVRDAIALNMRAYAAAQSGRLTGDWVTVTGNPLADIRAGIKPVRDRARDLQANDPTGHHIISTWALNVPGPKGFSLKSKALMSDGKTSDVEGNKATERAYYDWSLPQHCSVTGKMSRRMIEHFVMKQLGRDGEFLVRKVYNRSKYGFQLQPLDVELLDETYNDRYNGNIVVMGVEVDKWGKPVAYWIRVPNEQARMNGYYTVAPRERIPAGDIYHGFDFEYACQTRGVSWLAPIMLRMKGLGDWEQYSWLNAKLAASVGLFFKNQSSDPTQKEMTGDSVDAATDQVQMEFGPAMIKDIGNKDIASFTPNFPHQQHTPFVDGMLSRVGQGVDMSNSTLTMDASKANFSSARFAAANDQEAFRSHQQLMIETFLQPLYADWLLMAFLKNQIKLPSGAVIGSDKYEKFLNAGTFTGRTWGFIQPMQDATAAILLMENNLISPIEWFEEHGKDMYETYADIKSAKELRKFLDIESLDAAMDDVDTPEPKPEPIKKALRVMVDVLHEIDNAAIANDDERMDTAEQRLMEEVDKILKRKRNGHGTLSADRHDHQPT